MLRLYFVMLRGVFQCLIYLMLVADEWPFFRWEVMSRFVVNLRGKLLQHLVRGNRVPSGIIATLA